MAQTITVTGMSCEHCEQRVREALEEIDGVTSARVDRAEEQATIEGEADPDTLVAAVEKAGYEAVA
ncbi:MAG: heavy-metal-associated domain-containing protein [archaeon]